MYVAVPVPNEIPALARALIASMKPVPRYMLPHASVLVPRFLSRWELGLISPRVARHMINKEYERISEELHYSAMMIFTTAKFMRRVRDIEPCKTFVDEQIIELDLLLR